MHFIFEPSTAPWRPKPKIQYRSATLLAASSWSPQTLREALELKLALIEFAKAFSLILPAWAGFSGHVGHNTPPVAA